MSNSFSLPNIPYASHDAGTLLEEPFGWRSVSCMTPMAEGSSPTISFTATRNSKILGYVPLLGSLIGIYRIYQGVQEYRLFSKMPHFQSLSHRSVLWIARGSLESIPVLGGIVCVVIDSVATVLNCNRTPISVESETIPGVVQKSEFSETGAHNLDPVLVDIERLQEESKGLKKQIENIKLLIEENPKIQKLLVEDWNRFVKSYAVHESAGFGNRHMIDLKTPSAIERYSLRIEVLDLQRQLDNYKQFFQCLRPDQRTVVQKALGYV